ncbi:uncharacterized protein LOC143073743 [Mytilus galloprovincialis]|uniref:uncharacterized protein LOC143073743 n=1 Tax=Mytilus galloprovincialis TaxID=29158 RepID=UPI003F7B8EE3
MVDSDDWKKIGRGRSFVTSYTIKNLKLDKHYVCSVSAENKVGKGPAAEVESPVVQHQKPVKAIEKARTSKQSIKDKKENKALYSDVVKKNLTSRPTTVKSIGKASPSQPSFKNKKGGNKVLYCDKFKRNLTSRPIAEVPQAPANLKVKTRTNDKLTLEWTRPKAIGDSKVTGYNISLKMVDSDDWKKIGRGRSFVTSYTIKNLKLDKHYVCSVSAENKVGKGPAAEVESPVVQHQKPVKAIEKARTSKQSIKEKKENEALYSDVVKKNLTSRQTTAVKLPSLKIDKLNKKSIWKRPYKKTNGKCEGQKRRPYSVIPITTLQIKTRSGQKKQCTPDEEARQDIQLAQDKDGFVVRQIDNVKGKGVFASKFFQKGDFLMEYHGELISGNDGKRRLKEYPNSFGSYIMFFRFAEKEMCVDATFSKRIGKYVNDGIKSCQNARVRRIIVDTIPRVAIYAVQDISPGTEILYDYGVNDLPWRQSTSKTTQRCSVVLEKMCLADLKASSTVSEGTVTEDDVLSTQLAANQSVTEDDVLSTQLAANQSVTKDGVLSTQLSADQSVTEDDVLLTQLSADQSVTEDDVLSTQLAADQFVTKDDSDTEDEILATQLAADQSFTEDGDLSTQLAADQSVTEDDILSTQLAADQSVTEDDVLSTQLAADQSVIEDDVLSTQLAADQSDTEDDVLSTQLAADQSNTEDDVLQTQLAADQSDTEDDVLSTQLAADQSVTEDGDLSTQFAADQSVTEDDVLSTQLAADQSDTEDDVLSTQLAADQSVTEDGDLSTQFAADKSVTEDDVLSTQLAADQSVTEDDVLSTQLAADQSVTEDGDLSTQFAADQSVTEDDFLSTQLAADQSVTEDDVLSTQLAADQSVIEDDILSTQLAADQSDTEDDVLSTQLAADQSDTEDDVLSTQLAADQSILSTKLAACQSVTEDDVLSTQLAADQSVIEDDVLSTQLAADQSDTEDDVLSTQLAADQSDTEDDVLSTQFAADQSDTKDGFLSPTCLPQDNVFSASTLNLSSQLVEVVEVVEVGVDELHFGEVSNIGLGADTRVSPLKDSSATTLKMSSMEDVKVRSLSQVDCEEVLSEIWRSKSRDANTISKVGPYSISIDALNTIQHWLSDEVMNAYLYMLSEHLPKVCHINSVLMTAVFNDQPQIHSLLHQYDFKEFDTIIGAVHENENHWTLMVILLQQQIILYFNPMGELFLSEQKLLQNWFFFLKERSKLGLVDIATTQWNIGSLLHSKQEDDISCGLYVLKMAENVLSGTTLEFDMSQKDLNDFRMYVGKCLLSGKVSSFQEDITSIDSSMEQFGEMSTDTGSSEDVHIQTVISVDKSICDDDEQSTLEDNTSALGDNVGNVRYPCAICGNEFTDLQDFLDHMQKHLKEIKKGKKAAASTTLCNKKNSKDTSTVNNQSNTKPARYCIFCDKYCLQLSRHIQLVHKEEDRVKAALKFSPRTKNKMFSQFKKEGIHLNNIEKLGKDSHAVLERERISQKDSVQVMCDNCNAILTKKAMSRHRATCQGGSSKQINAIPAQFFIKDNDVSESFVKNILTKFTKDDIGKICKSDNLVKKVGSILWAKNRTKVDQLSQVRKSVMNDMRRLAHAYNFFKEEVKKDHPLLLNTAADMFNRIFFKDLQEAVCKYTEVGDQYGETSFKLKHGLKYALYYVLKKSAEILRAEHLSKFADDKAEEVTKFLHIFETTKNLYFSDALFNIRKNRQVNLRKPHRIPDEDLLFTIRQYTIESIKKIVEMYNEYKIWTRSDFVKLRNLVVCRLTMFNGRRGGEACRLLRSEFKDAVEDNWVNKKWRNDPYVLQQELKIAYEAGKGMNKLVPVLFTPETMAATVLLDDDDLRQQGEVLSNNMYVFANTQNSLEYVNGYTAMQRVASDAGIREDEAKKINATLIRHFTSTEMAAKDIPENERQYFYTHMGHSEEMNKQTYQAPLAVMEIVKVGKHLKDIDNALALRQHQDTSSSPCKIYTAEAVDSINSNNTSLDIPQSLVEHVSESDNTDLEYHIEPHPDEELNSDSVLNKNKGCKRKLELDDYDLVDIKQPVKNKKLTEPEVDGSKDNSENEIEKIPLIELNEDILLKDGEARRTKLLQIMKKENDKKNGRDLEGLTRNKLMEDKRNIWKQMDTEKVRQYFQDYITDSAQKPSPDATEIDDFKAKYPDITCNVDVIKVKVMNEKKERKRKLERELSYIDAIPTVKRKYVEEVESDEDNVKVGNSGFSKARQYSRWSDEETICVQEYFKDYITEKCEKPYPGKVDIQKFLSSHQSIKFDWNKVKVKIMNEKKERKRKIEKGLKWIKYK